MSEDTALSITHYRDVRVEWKIEEFFSLSEEVDSCKESPLFSLSLSKWFLQIRPNGETRNKSEGWISLYVFKKESTEECSVAYSIGIKKCDGSELLLVEGKPIFPLKYCGWGIAKGFERSALERSKDILDSDGSLTVFCTIRIENTNTKEVEVQTISSYDIPTLTEDLKHVYLDRQYTDITIKVKNKELTAHKCILAGRSKVFAAMFQHDMAEKCSGTVEIDDSDPDSFEDFIMYLYTGKLDLVSSSNAASLFKDADKYDVAELRKECVRTMVHELNVESFCDVVHLAVVHEEAELLTAATAFFSNNLKTILKTPKWQGFLAENPTFGNELILKALDNTENK